MNRATLVIPLVLLVTGLGATGQTLLKLAIGRLPATAGMASIAAALCGDWAFWAGGLIVAAGGLTWLYVLSRADITYAMPFLGTGLLFTMVTSALVLHESQPPLRIAGTVVMAAGMALVALAR